MEKFDPSDPKYKRVEDLPLEVRDRFADVENGFARKDALPLKEAQKEADKLGPALNETDTLIPHPTRWQKILFAIGGTPEFSHPTTAWLKNDDSLLGTFLTELWKKEADKALDQLSDNELFQSRELYRSHVSNWIERQIDLARFDAFEEQAKALERRGHTGHLVKNILCGHTWTLHDPNYARGYNSYTSRTDREIMEGEIDGRPINIVCTSEYVAGRVDSTCKGKVDSSKKLSSEEAVNLYRAYSPIALDLKQFDLRQRAISEKALAALDDQTIDEDVKEMYQQFRQSLNKKTSMEVKSDIEKEERRVVAEARDRTQIEQAKQKQEALKRRNNIITSLYPKQK